jgi:glycine dehydrogenase subunit 2
MELIFEKSVQGRTGYHVPRSDVPDSVLFPDRYLRKTEAQLPEVSELDVVRHFTRLSRQNYSVDTHFYPLGSCTMKYNPKFTELIASFRGFAHLHPLLPQLDGSLVQGALEVLYQAEQWLKEIKGMDGFTMQPMAGAHGELTGIMLMAAYHRKKGNQKKFIIIPDSAHGTNPASAAIAGYDIVTVKTQEHGILRLKDIKEKINNDLAGIMLTCPNTLGIFNPEIDQIADLVHRADGLVYYDGANLNALLGRARPGDLGFDIVHINLHKTFAAPHGGGGPGAGPVGVKKTLMDFLPISRVIQREDGRYELAYNFLDSIGYISAFYGNFSVILKAYSYMLLLGREGLKEVANQAVLNANYIMESLKKDYDLPYDRRCMHECVFSASRQEKHGVHAIDIAKFLIDEGFHPPTVYFPLIVPEAIMIEPTETESKNDIDLFISVMKKAARLAEENPSLFKTFPRSTPITRPDEVLAAKEIRANYFSKK